MASPRELPMMPPSASGVSTTRSGPKRSRSPRVVRKTPPSRPTSSPSRMTRSSLSISKASASRMASTMFISLPSGGRGVGWGFTWGAALQLPDHAQQLFTLPEKPPRRVAVDVVEDLGCLRRGQLAGRCHGGVDLLVDLALDSCPGRFVPDAESGQVGLDAPDRLLPLRLLEPALKEALARGVSRVVEAEAEGDT